ncbi:MerR family transcriptional regulator [Microbacterium sp. cx-55]|uniref:MerR family transcriptional regulator n=1 Tax=Microbacterium sp. cx-55 TaxID=2875948 RepID=UPI001CBA9685|nr:MerR family transcriptional regulator [Microbacterium sp. cx-55]MBZ4487371.1 MerR family transcriptional regulator [Microbacterium sp. cx-55]UGB35391.1 MerR family transcriptional regulator [Microbacterium sp. cx-55]
MEWSIHEVARMSGTTSRTLRHYDAVGLLRPSRVADNGYRQYDERAVLRLQRILLLRELGLGLARIRAVLDLDESETTALRHHLDALRHEQDRIGRQIAAVENTIDVWEKRGEVMVEKMFDGFDHTRHQQEVEERWGTEAAVRSDEWWTGLDATARTTWQQDAADLNAQWRAAAERRADPAGDEARDLARRHIAWLEAIPGMPASASDGDTAAYVRGLGELYVADARFGANYGGDAGAAFVRDALNAYLDDPR